MRKYFFFVYISSEFFYLNFLNVNEHVREVYAFACICKKYSKFAMHMHSKEFSFYLFLIHANANLHTFFELEFI